MKVTSRKPKPGETVFGGGTGVLLGGFAKQQPDAKKNGPETREPEEDDLVRWMTRQGITVTREKYVALAYHRRPAGGVDGRAGGAAAAGAAAAVPEVDSPRTGLIGP